MTPPDDEQDDSNDVNNESDNRDQIYESKEQARKELCFALVNYFNAAKAFEMDEQDQINEVDGLLVEAGKLWDITPLSV